ncbi:hypothetical protein P879_04318, partial [Paragonimus westermani]
DLIQVDCFPLVPFQGISRVLRSIKKFTKDEARLMFLLLIHELPTFGSTFFEVTQNRNPEFPDRIILGVNQAGILVIDAKSRQNRNPEFPDRIILGVNQAGILVIDAKSRKLLTRIAFGDLSNWSYSKTSISFTIGNLVSCIVFDCETQQGYELDELIRAYRKQLEPMYEKLN